MMLRPKTYRLLERCVEDGVGAGYNRAFKHQDDPSPETIKNAIVDAVMLEVMEWFDVVEPGEDYED